jgi:hypothetical protein
MCGEESQILKLPSEIIDSHPILRNQRTKFIGNFMKICLSKVNLPETIAFVQEDIIFDVIKNIVQSGLESHTEDLQTIREKIV